jgi:hypothetical protein
MLSFLLISRETLHSKSKYRHAPILPLQIPTMSSDSMLRLINSLICPSGWFRSFDRFSVPNCLDKCCINKTSTAYSEFHPVISLWIISPSFSFSCMNILAGSSYLIMLFKFFISSILSLSRKPFQLNNQYSRKLTFVYSTWL